MSDLYVFECALDEKNGTPELKRMKLAVSEADEYVAVAFLTGEEEGRDDPGRSVFLKPESAQLLGELLVRMTEGERGADVLPPGVEEIDVEEPRAMGIILGCAVLAVLVGSFVSGVYGLVKLVGLLAGLF